MTHDAAGMAAKSNSTGRRSVLGWTAALASAAGFGGTAARAQAVRSPDDVAPSFPGAPGKLRRGMLGYMLASEQFTAPELLDIGAHASRAGFPLLATSDHFQPWQANEGHATAAWATLGALGARAEQSWMGTTVTCPIFRYSPAVVAETFATLDQLYPGRIFLGVGSGEALNERAATGAWPKWQERWDRLAEAMDVIRKLWTGEQVSHKGTYYTIDARLYDPPKQPIPLLAAANGRKSMRLAGQHADGLVTDPLTWKQHKSEWEAGARAAGKDPAAMPVLVEQYVVVGSDAEAKQAAELWRFGPKAFKGYFNVTDPAQIQQKAEAEVPVEKVLEGYAVGTDPQVHVAKVRELFDSGVSIVNIHSGQADQKKVIDFYASHVLPKFARAS